MPNTSHLRPLERRILALRNADVPIEEIARRFDRSPAQIGRIIEWTALPRTKQPHVSRVAAAMERRVLRLRYEGHSHEEIGRRFRRSSRFIRQVEGLAHYRRGLALLSNPA